jgi:GLPGLI family protein
MKYLLLSYINLLFCFFSVNSQTNNICAVKYKDYSTNLGTFNYWFQKDRIIGINEHNYKAQFSNGFPIIKNGVMVTETDTIKYKKEYNEFINDLKLQMSKHPQDVKFMHYNSDVLFTSIIVSETNKNYIVVDTFSKMSNWKILSDTMTFMGFKCQKATIVHNGQNFVAWFCSDLPYNAGPNEFRGLPGLILKVVNSNGAIGYEAVEILTPYKGSIPVFNDNGLTISRNDWISFIKEYNKKAKEARRNQLEQERKQQEAINE